MKKMLLLALCASLFSVMIPTSAQRLSVDNLDLPPYKLGLTAGFNASSFTAPHYDGKAGFHFGVNAIFDASELLQDTYVRTELLFQRKGASQDWADAKFRTCYLELPVHYGYAYLLNKDWTLIGETGPYVALGIGGRARYDMPDGLGGSRRVSEKFFTNEYMGEDDPRNLDFGWGFHVGAIFQQNHQLTVGWDFGFINMNDALDQNRNFMISYTYYVR